MSRSRIPYEMSSCAAQTDAYAERVVVECYRGSQRRIALKLTVVDIKRLVRAAQEIVKYKLATAKQDATFFGVAT